MTTTYTQPGAACLPITALLALSENGYNVILLGSGCHLLLLDPSTSRVLFRQQAFVNQNIHGITCCSVVRNGGNVTARLYLWGGPLVQSVLLNVSLFRDESGVCESAHVRARYSQPITVGDWIFHAAPLNDGSFSIVTLTAQNKLYAIQSGDDRSSLESRKVADGPPTFLYSGCVTFDLEGTVLVASGTVFGEVMFWSCKYSGDRLCEDVRLISTFYGHRGSVFGVSISPRFEYGGQSRQVLASCSDDRTIRIWNVSPGKFQDETLHQAHLKNQETGFHTEKSEGSELTMNWGHLSRIWGVHFLPAASLVSLDNMHLTSTGEDGVCQLWEIDLGCLFDTRKTGLAFKSVQNDRRHSGKHIWALTYSVGEDSATVYSGGADGCVVMRNYKLESIVSPSERYLQSFRNISDTIEPDDKDHIRGPFINAFKSLRAYVMIDYNRVLATTDTGALLKGTLHGQKMTWSVIMASEGKKPVTLCSNLAHRFAFFFDHHESALRTYDEETGEILKVPVKLPTNVSWLRVVTCEESVGPIALKICLAVSVFDETSTIRIIWLDFISKRFEAKESTLTLPDSFIVTSASYGKRTDTLVCGSRAGAVVVFGNIRAGSQQPVTPLCVRHVHGSDSVISAMFLDFDTEQETESQLVSFLLTTGRDGTYQIHRLTHERGESGALRLSAFQTVHNASPPFGPYVEGAVLAVGGNSVAPGSQAFRSQAGPLTDQTKLLLYGFRSKEFVVWDETSESQVFRVDCGGAHRSWACHLTGERGTFVWTKAGSFCMYEKPESSEKTIVKGGHGREIKAVAVHTDANGDILIATGAEDTTIRLFKYKPNVQAWNCVAIMRKHTTGLQCLRFSPCGRFLFSAGGVEEFFAWSLHSVPVLQIGTVFEDALPPEEEDSDARIMNFDIRAHDQDEKKDFARFTVTAAYSNGKTKIFEYSHGPAKMDRGFTPLHEIDLGAQCLTVTNFGSRWDEDVYKVVLIGATNGFVHICPTGTTVVEEGIGTGVKHLHRIHQSSITNLEVVNIDGPTDLLITTGDDNAIGITTMSSSSTVTSSDERGSDQPRFQTLLLPKAHAAAVTALVVLDVEWETSPGFHSGPRPGPDFDSELKVGSVCSRIVFATAGNDQVIRIWMVEVCPHVQNERTGRIEDVPIHGVSTEEGKGKGKEETERKNDGGGENKNTMMSNIQIRLLTEQWTSVADISGMDKLSFSKKKKMTTSQEAGNAKEGRDGDGNKDKSNDTVQSLHTDILVVGVGMESFSVEIDMPL